MAASVNPRLSEPIHGLQLIQPGNTVVPLQLIMPGETVVPLQQGKRALLLKQENNFENLTNRKVTKIKLVHFISFFYGSPTF